MSISDKKSIYKLLTIVAALVVTGTSALWFLPGLSLEGSVRLTSKDALQNATVYLEEQAGSEYTKTDSPILTVDWVTEQFTAETLVDQQEAYYERFGLPRFVYECKLTSSAGVEFSISVDAHAGVVVAWNAETAHEVYQDNALVDTSRDTALSYLEGRGHPSSSLSLLSEDKEMIKGGAGSSIVAYRTTYLQQGSEVDSTFGRGYVTHTVRSVGQNVVGYSQAFSVPQGYTEHVLQMQESGASLEFIFTLLYLCTFFLAVYVIYQYRSRFRVIYRTPFVLALCIGALSILEAVNGASAIGRLFGEIDAGGIFLPTLVYFGMSIVMYALPFFVFLTAGIMLYEQAKLPGNVFFPSGAGTNHLTKGILVGYGASTSIIVVLLLTMLAETSSMMNDSLKDFEYLIATQFPSFSVIAIVSLIPAFVEEVAYRLFAFLFITRISESRMVGAVGTTIFWVLPHVELGGTINSLEVLHFTLFGFVLMYVFLRHGILVATLTHYLVNMTLGVALLVSVFASNEQVVWTAIFMLALPAIAGVCSIVYKEWGVKCVRRG